MKKHTKIYMDYFGYGEQDFIPCENCGKRAVDIHHIDPKKMGGSKDKDNINNLCALCRGCHNMAHDGKLNKDNLILIHRYTIANYNSRLK